MKKTFIRKGLFACIAAIVGIASSFAQTITTGAVDASVCAGSTISVPFATTGTVGTDFTVQLSDATGAFTAPVAIGTGTASPISAIVPFASAGGSAYKVRVITLTPSIIGDPSIAFTIKELPVAPTGSNFYRLCVGGAPVTLTANGQNLKWYAYDAQGVGNALSAAPTINPTSSSAPTSPSYYVTQTVNGCEGAKLDISVAVSLQTAAPIVTQPAPLCQNGAVSNAILTSSVTGPDTHLWYETLTGPALTVAPTPSTAVVGSQDFYVSEIASRSCESTKVKVTVTVNPTPAAPTVVSPVNYTKGATSSQLPTVTNGTWYEVATGGSGSGIAPTPSTGTVGTKSYFVSQKTGDCEGPRSEIIVNVAEACTTPAAPVVVSPVTYTVGQTPVSLSASATALAGNTLKWWGNDATGGTPATTAPTPLTTTAGTLIYYVSQITASGCESPRAAISVVVSACTTPAAPVVVSPVTYTVGQTPVSLSASATALAGNTLKWWGNDATGGTPATTAPTPLTTTAGTLIYYVSQITASGCESPRAAISVVVSACTAPAAPVVVSPVTYTVGQTPVSLSASATALAGNTLKWWGNDATGGTPATTAPTPLTTTAGTLIYYVSQITASGCESPRAAISVVVSACTTPAAPVVVSPVTYTVGQTPVSLSASATALAGNTLKWWGNDATGGTPATTAPTPLTTTAGTLIYYVSQITASGCESPRAAISVVVSACTAPAAPVVVSPVTYTVGQTPVSLSASATALAGNTLKWWGNDATGGTPATTAPTPLTTTAGTLIYYVSQITASGCESPRAAISVVVSACTTPAAPVVVSPVTYTVGQTPVSLSASAIALAGNTLKWWGNDATGGTPATTAPTPLTTTAGTLIYYVSQITASGCESPRAAISVLVSACTAPAAPVVVSPVTYTVGQTPVSLSASAIALAGNTLKWWGNDATGGTPATTAPTPLTTTAGTLIYYVSQITASGCESPRAAISVVVSACTAPAAPVVVSPVTYTVGQTPVSLSASATALAGNTLKWWGNDATGGTPATTAPTPLTTTAGTVTYYVSQITTATGCESPRSAIVVIVSSCTTVAPTVTNITYCLSETPIALTATGTALKWYTVSTGGTALASAPIPSTATAGTTSYYVSQTLNGCEGERAKIDVTVNPQTAAPTVTNVTYCLSETAVALTATGSLLKWYSGATGGAALASAPIPSTTTAGTTSYYVSQTVNGCEGTRAKIDVTVNPQTIAPAVTATIKYCFNASPTVLTATGTALKWYTAATGGTALSAAPTPSAATAGTTSYYVSQTLNGCEGLRAKIDVIVSPQTPAPTITASTLEYCQSVKAPALSATALSGATLNWYGTNATGGTSSPAPPVPSTDTEGTVTYYVGQTDANGCASARAAISVKTNVTPKPVVATPSVAYCQNATASALVATGSNLKWYLTIDDTSPRTTPLTPYTLKVEDYSFYVTQTGTNTCESAKAEIKVHIKPLPSATISGNSSIPLGGTANVNIAFTGDAPWSYILSNGFIATTSNANLSVSVSPTTTTTYVLTEVSNSCGKGIPNGSALVTVQVPTLTIGVPSVSESCAGKTFTVQFQQSGTFPDGSTIKAQISTTNETSKFVSIPSVINGNVITATIPDTTVKGIYYVRIANIGKDGALIAAGNVSSGQITVNPLPVATISGASTIYLGATANLKVDLTGDAPWTFSLNNGLVDSLVSTSVNPIIVKVTPKTTTTYTISKVSNLCGSGRGAGTARIQVDPVLGTEPPVVSADWLKIYPTLVDSKCTVEITSAVSAKEADVEILDLNGRSLFKKSIRQKITEVDFSQRPAGLYLLKVQNGKYSSVQRILKP